MVRITTRLATLAVALFAAAGLTTAQVVNDRGPQSGLTAVSSSSELNMTATVNNALRVDIETAPGGVTVSGAVPTTTGIFSLNLGDVNGLGLGTPAAGVTKTQKTGGYLYSTPIKVTPYFSGLTTGIAGTGNGTLTVQLDATGGTADSAIITREGDSPSNMNTPLLVAPTPVTTSAQNGTSVTRHVGFFIPTTNTVTTANQSARVVYRIIPLGLP